MNRRTRRWVLGTVLIAVIIALISPMIALAVDGQPNAPEANHGIPLDQWDALAAFLIPAVVQFVKQRRWDDELTRFVSVLLVAVYTAGRYYLNGDLDHVGNWTVTLIGLIAATQASYNLVWKSKLLAPISAALGSAIGGPPQTAQRAGYQGVTTNTPPPAA